MDDKIKAAARAEGEKIQDAAVDTSNLGNFFKSLHSQGYDVFLIRDTNHFSNWGSPAHSLLKSIAPASASLVLEVAAEDAKAPKVEVAGELKPNTLNQERINNYLRTGDETQYVAPVAKQYVLSDEQMLQELRAAREANGAGAKVDVVLADINMPGVNMFTVHKHHDDRMKVNPIFAEKITDAAKTHDIVYARVGRGHFKEAHDIDEMVAEKLPAGKRAADIEIGWDSRQLPGIYRGKDFYKDRHDGPDIADWVINAPPVADIERASAVIALPTEDKERINVTLEAIGRQSAKIEKSLDRELFDIPKDKRDLLDGISQANGGDKGEPGKRWGAMLGASLVAPALISGAARNWSPGDRGQDMQELSMVCSDLYEYSKATNDDAMAERIRVIRDQLNELDNLGNKAENDIRSVFSRVPQSAVSAPPAYSNPLSSGQGR